MASTELVAVTRDTILWFVDSGAEGHLAVSLGSLRLAAPSVWRSTTKVVIDCGLSSDMLAFLSAAASEGVHVVPAFKIWDEPWDPTSLGILPMRMRIHAPRLLSRRLAGSFLPPASAYLVCDADTVFWHEFKIPTPGADSDLLIMQEWDNKTGVDVPMLLVRQSTFALPLEEVHLETISRALGLPEDTLRTLPTYNTGVFTFVAGAGFTDAWHHDYQTIIALRDHAGRRVFSPFAAEQNALSVAIQRGTISAGPLPRRFNQFPPRPPRLWPAGTVIAHFVTFRRNYREARYAAWFEAQDAVRAEGWVPEPLLSVVQWPR
ncbi:MAG: hypothetical protein ABI779_27605 [Acidobacteriota bacterium]